MLKANIERIERKGRENRDETICVSRKYLVNLHDLFADRDYLDTNLGKRKICLRQREIIWVVRFPAIYSCLSYLCYVVC